MGNVYASGERGKKDGRKGGFGHPHGHVSPQDARISSPVDSVVEIRSIKAGRGRGVRGRAIIGGGHGLYILRSSPRGVGTHLFGLARHEDADLHDLRRRVVEHRTIHVVPKTEPRLQATTKAALQTSSKRRQRERKSNTIRGRDAISTDRPRPRLTPTASSPACPPNWPPIPISPPPFPAGRRVLGLANPTEGRAYASGCR